jgi:hypothetical protein
MRVLNILIIGSDQLALQQIAQVMADEGVRVFTSNRLIDALSAEQEWDFLLVDLDGLNSFLRGLLPVVSGDFPNLPLIGISRRKNLDAQKFEADFGLSLDAYVLEAPRPEDLIVSFPQVAAKYLCDTGTLRQPGTRPLPG